VAVKVLTPRSLADSVVVRRFEREARTAARIQHPNVTPVFRDGTLANGARYLVIQYVDGGSLEDRLAALGPLPIAEARRMIGQIAAGLAAAHRQGIVHRDVRPANVLYDRQSERVLLTDFGTARLLETGEDATPLTGPADRIGVPAYVSPEQLQGEPVTERADIYSLGVVGFELLTGKLPFPAQTPVDMVVAHVHETAPSVRTLRPDVDPALDALIGRCLKKSPQQRPFAAEIASMLLTQ
jgi:eukaryotic-like serine/threonine-protein kinase